MARKTASSGSAAGKVVSKSTAARKSARKTANGSVVAAAKKSTEITPRRAALARTASSLKSPKLLVPLAVAVGVGIAAVRKAVIGAHGESRTLPRIAKDVSPRFSEAVHTLAELGRELRAKIR